MTTSEVQLYEETDTLQFRDPNQPNIHLRYRTVKKLEKKDGATIVFWVHGIGEHSGRSKCVAEQLLTRCSNLDAFMSFDLRGHGESEGARGVTLGLHELHTDIKSHILPHMVIKYGTDAKVLIAGHSLGGSIVVDMLLEEKTDFLQNDAYGQIEGIALSAPAIAIPIKGFWNRVLAPIAPALNIIPGIKKLTKASEIDGSQLSHDENVQKNNDADPLMHGQLSLGLAGDLLKLYPKMNNTVNNDAVESILKKVPVWIAHSPDDSITDIQGSRDLVKALEVHSSSKATLIEIQEARHEMMFELDEFGRKDFFDSLVSFVNEIFPDPSPSSTKPAE